MLLLSIAPQSFCNIELILSREEHLQELEARDEFELELRVRDEARHLLAEGVAEEASVLLRAADRFGALERRHQLREVLAPHRLTLTSE